MHRVHRGASWAPFHAAGKTGHPELGVCQRRVVHAHAPSPSTCRSCSRRSSTRERPPLCGLDRATEANVRLDFCLELDPEGVERAVLRELITKQRRARRESGLRALESVASPFLQQPRMRGEKDRAIPRRRAPAISRADRTNPAILRFLGLFGILSLLHLTLRRIRSPQPGPSGFVVWGLRGAFLGGWSGRGRGPRCGSFD